MRCKHCSSGYGDIGEDLTFDNIIKVSKWAQQTGIEQIVLTGGEIYICNNITQILKNIRKLYSGNITLLTNGTLISESDIANICKYVTTVEFSLDGYDEESVSKIRGKNVFSKVISNIQKLQQVGFKNIGLSCVISGDNGKAYKFSELCKQLNVAKHIRILSLQGRAGANYDELKGDTSERFSDINKSLSMKSICSFGIDSITIMPDGKVLPCQTFDYGMDFAPIEFEYYLNSRIPVSNFIPIVDQVEPCKYCNIRYFCSDACYSMDYATYLTSGKREEICELKKLAITNEIWCANYA